MQNEDLERNYIDSTVTIISDYLVARSMYLNIDYNKILAFIETGIINHCDVDILSTVFSAIDPEILKSNDKIDRLILIHQVVTRRPIHMKPNAPIKNQILLAEPSIIYPISVEKINKLISNMNNKTT